MQKRDTKNTILTYLEQNRGGYISGETMAEILGISRAGVWKAIKALKKEGYQIKAVPNQGYSLSGQNNILSEQSLSPYLTDEAYIKNIHVYPSLESTNKTAKEMAIGGHVHGTIVMADSQTEGRGRLGRSFYSPPGDGLYMSILLRSQFLSLPDITRITIAAAVAVCKAVHAVCGKEAKVKWVNDILLDDKKICGILTEAVTDFESGNIDWVVVGIGINIYMEEETLPPELRQIVGSIYSDKKMKQDGSVRSRLAAEIINQLLSVNTWAGNDQILSEYKSRLSMLGDRITVMQANETYEATAIDIDQNANLIVEKKNGSRITLSFGEISIRKKK